MTDLEFCKFDWLKRAHGNRILPLACSPTELGAVMKCYSFDFKNVLTKSFGVVITGSRDWGTDRVICAVVFNVNVLTQVRGLS